MVKDGIKNIWYSLPDFAKVSLSHSYWKVYRNYLKIKYWYLYNREEKAYMNPFNIYWISPDRISYYSTIRFGSRLGPIVKGGDWDTSIKLFADRGVYLSFVQRFIEGKDWSETQRYTHMRNSFESISELRGKEKYGRWADRIGGIEAYDDALQKYDIIYRNMKNDGYKTQREIQTLDFRCEKPWATTRAIPEYNEINIDIGRDGTLLWFHGQHRLSLAKILNLEKVPVRVRCRHRKWQDKRNRAISDPDSLSSNEKAHFDMPLH